MNLQANITQMESRLNEACARSGRRRQDVRVIAVTKYVDLETTREVLRQGILHIGENRWQDAREKWEQLGSQGTWHFIGHLQSNKARDVIGKFHYIHSLDRLSLAREIHKIGEQRGQDVNCFIQMNISGEASKYGLAPEQLFAFVKQIKPLHRIRIVGLMTMAPHSGDERVVRPVFSGLRGWRERLNEQGILDYEVPHLSMGMSNDFEIAVEEGATWVRLGSVLTGQG